MPSVRPGAMRKQKRVYDWAWPPPARFAYSRDDWPSLPFVNRTEPVPELAVVESSAIVESLEESASQSASEPDSKSSLRKVPGATPPPERATACGLPAASSVSVRDA